MATVRDGRRTVLMVVDVQKGVVQGCWEADRVVANVARAVERARSAGVPVIWVQHADDELAEGSEAWQWAAPLAPAEGEVRIGKRHNSAFEDTALDGTLARLQATHVVLAGAATNWCIRATAYGALDRGYDLTLVGDAHTTGPIELGGGRVVAAADIVGELNAAMRWLSYPGRRNAVAGIDELDFAAP